MASGLAAWLTRAVPPSLRGDVDRERRALLALGIAWFIFAIGLVIGAVLLLVANPAIRLLSVVNTIVTCSLAALGMLMVRRGALVLAGNWIAALVSIGVAYSVVSGGGVGAPFWITLPVSPVLALVIAGRRSGFAWALVNAAFAAAVALLQVAGVTFPDLNPPEGIELITLLATLAVIVVTLWVAAYSEELKAASIRQVEETARQRDLALAEEEKARIAAEQAIAANTAKSVFLATMSHELRTPLNVIIGYSELIDEEIGDRLGEHAESLGRIHEAGEHLLAVIADILDLARIEADRLELTPTRFDLDDLLRDVRAIFEPIADRRHNTIELDLPAPLGDVLLDKVRVRQILVNLIGNANKFTDAGTITLGGRRERRGGRAWAILEVRDTGVGIPADRLDAIFEPFTQADTSSTRAHEGSGLGLTIVRRLARMMGGDVTIASEVGVGTRVEIHLPAAE